MKARVLQEQADLFEVGVLSQTAEVVAVSMEDLLASPAGPPIVVVGRLLAASQLTELRRFAVAAARAQAAILLVPPFNDLEIGRYFETPVEVRAQRRTSSESARIVDQSAAAVLGAVLGNAAKVRSDHYFETALGSGVVAVDEQGKPVLIRFHATNTSGPVFFSALQLLTYTALTDEGQRQATLAHLLSWVPEAQTKPTPPRDAALSAPGRGVSADAVVPVALLVAAGGAQSGEVLVRRASEFLGTDLSVTLVNDALAALAAQGLLQGTPGDWTPTPNGLREYLERLGLHAYLRELQAMLAIEERHA
ncbi:hypothetical protein D7X30_40660 [Corallococcus sp. AB011P]|uniref:hypothetical protein n=1 Tax=Corallococcus sp. AB011P TaxID=2316735 RepID=UPI000EA2F0D4|nr:hypothetical protein [Corallococcus sp. AB011P]RKG48485.1 hypothetical protein D7X30_40660 [Corallococcus sp. AB011P]